MSIFQRLGAFPTGPEGTRITLEQMRVMVRAFVAHPDIRSLAESIVAGVGEKDFAGEAAAIHVWVRDEIRYVLDPVGIEMPKPPLRTLKERQGDCEDMVVLASTLLESIGHPTRFLALAFDAGGFSHVVVETRIGNVWVASDPTEPHEFGWRPPGSIGPGMVRHV